LRSGLSELIVTLPTAYGADVRDDGCPANPIQVRLVRHVAAKVLCDNLQALIAHEACKQHQVPPARRINHPAAFSILKSVMSSLLQGGSIPSLLSDALAMMTKRTYSHRARRSNPRHPKPKPHKFMAG
jgi:hypothetical protein